MALTLGALAERIGGALHNGDPGCEVSSVATLQHAGSGDISFLSNRSYRKYLAATRAGAVILAPDDLPDCPVAAIVVDNPYVAYARAAALLFPPQADRQGVHPAAVVDEGCEIHASAWVGPHTVIEAGVRIAAGVQIAGGCHIGADTAIGPGCRIRSPC